LTRDEPLDAQSPLVYPPAEPSAVNSEQLAQPCAALREAQLASMCELHDKVTNLERAPQTSRMTGAAIGILMATRRVTGEAAFELLRIANQVMSHRKLPGSAPAWCSPASCLALSKGTRVAVAMLPGPDEY
jgi:hypothetical protein